MAATNVQAFSGDVEISSNLAVNTNDLFVDTVSESVGIGTTEPAAKLHVTSGQYDGTTLINLSVNQSSDATVYYRKIAFVNNNSGHVLIKGVLGGHSQAQGNATVDVKFSKRDGFTALGTCMGNLSNSNILVKDNTGDTRQDIYLVTGQYSYVNLQVYAIGGEVFGTAENQPTSTAPSGTTTHDLKENFKTFRVDDDGRVGIGTTDPIAALDIVGGAPDDTTPSLSIGGGNHPCSDLYVLNSLDVNTGVGFGAKVIGVNIKNKVETDNTVEIRRNDGGLTSAGALYFGTDDRDQGIFGVLGGDGAAGTTLSEFLTIRSTGLVGIGTTNPGVNLELEATNPKIRLTDNRLNTATDGLELGAIEWYSRESSLPNDYDPVAKIAVHVSDTSVAPDGEIRFSTGINGTLTERMIIMDGGNVGIGTLAPTGNLQISSDLANADDPINPSAQLVLHSSLAGLDDSGDIGASLVFTQRWSDADPNSQGTMGSIHGYKDYSSGNYGGGLVFKTQPAADTPPVDRMRIDHVGNVGIGTADPGYKLHVEGSLAFVSPWSGSSSVSKTQFSSATYFSCIPTNTVTNYIGYKVQIRFDPSPGNPPYSACAYVDWFPIGTNSVGPQYNEQSLLTTAHAPNGLNHSMTVSGTMGLGVGTSGLRLKTASNYYTGTFTTRWYQVGSNV